MMRLGGLKSYLVHEAREAKGEELNCVSFDPINFSQMHLDSKSNYFIKEN